MGKPLRVLSLLHYLFHLLIYVSFVLSDSTGKLYNGSNNYSYFNIVLSDRVHLFFKGCHLISCLKCDGNNGTQCTKCSQLVLRSKHCEETSCPPGYLSRWTSLTDYMSSACQGNNDIFSIKTTIS